MKGGKKCFMKFLIGDPFSTNSTFFSLIIPPTQKRGFVADMIKKSQILVLMDMFLSSAYAWQWQITALHIHAYIRCVYVIVEMYAHTCIQYRYTYSLSI